MKTIEVYHSVWKMILLIIVCFAFAAMGVFMLFRGERAWFDWIGIIFFGGGGLFMTYLVLNDLSRIERVFNAYALLYNHR